MRPLCLILTIKTLSLVRCTFKESRLSRDVSGILRFDIIIMDNICKERNASETNNWYQPVRSLANCIEPSPFWCIRS